MMGQSNPCVVLLGTGGTIAGTAARAEDNVGYLAAQLEIGTLVDDVPALQSMPLEVEQVLQTDSKDMDYAGWRLLVQRLWHHLERDDVQGIVVTHGSDTLEETAYLVQRVLAPAKPVVLTAAMRPATALLADGRQSLLDAVAVAREPGARGTVVVMAGTVFDAIGVRKWHSYRLDAFDAGDAGPLARVEEGQVRRFREWPRGTPLGPDRVERAQASWPRVEIVLNHAGADGRIVYALLAHGVDGIVLAGTGNGTASTALTQALQEAQRCGVRVRAASRCSAGLVVGEWACAPPMPPDLSPVQMRVELILELLGRGCAVPREPDITTVD